MKFLVKIRQLVQHDVEIEIEAEDEEDVRMLFNAGEFWENGEEVSDIEQNIEDEEIQSIKEIK